MFVSFFLNIELYTKLMCVSVSIYILYNSFYIEMQLSFGCLAVRNTIDIRIKTMNHDNNNDNT